VIGARKPIIRPEKIDKTHERGYTCRMSAIFKDPMLIAHAAPAARDASSCARLYVWRPLAMRRPSHRTFACLAQAR
jgi:hypothetical protein